MPPIFVGLLWIGANAVIMGDPLDFVYGDYGYGTFQHSADQALRKRAAKEHANLLCSWAQPRRSAAMANKEQRSNREKRKPKKEKPKPAPQVGSRKT